MVHRLVLNLRAYSQNETAMSRQSKSELTFHAAYGRSPNSGGGPSRSTVASFMAIEELGGLLGPIDDDDGRDEGPHQAVDSPDFNVESEDHVIEGDISS